jgi:uncharacterized protein
MGKLPKDWNEAAKSITFCVTEDCNLACKYCYMTGKNKKNKMQFDVAKKAVDYILDNREVFKEEAVVWEFIGGEPFLEMELIDRICDYIKQQMFLLNHPWFDNYRFNFSTNGILYDTLKVQKFIWKNKGHTSIGISIDGNKIKHDLQRVKPDGSGSFEDVVKNIPLWLEQFPVASTKSTFSHEDLPHLKDSIIALWDLGITMVAANVVFEDVWHDGDDMIFENQLKELADHVIDNNLYYNYSVRFFDPQVGNPLTEDNLNANYCGSGKMLAIDCNGNFYPCVRFYDMSLKNKKGYKIGDIYSGINKDKLRPFQSLTLKNQSTEECITCEIGRGCAWCSGCNYDYADTDTIYQRATHICKMHKANVRANEYFWSRFSEVTGLPSEKEKLKQSSTNHQAYGDDIKFMQIMRADKIIPHCNYRTNKAFNSKMSSDIFEKSMEFCRKNGFVAVLLEDSENIENSDGDIVSIVSARSANIPKKSIVVFDNNCAETLNPSGNCILIINKENLIHLGEFVEELIFSNNRINIILEDIDKWIDGSLDIYEKQLEKIVDIVKDRYVNGSNIEINVLTDLWNLKEMCNCDAGETSFTIAPNGKIYYCPAFYFDDPEGFIGSLDDGIEIKNRRLLDAKNSPICNSCDVFSCKRCKFLNKSLTGEISVPSRIQCLVSHLERKMSMKLQTILRDERVINPINNIKEISYSDPWEVVISKKY